MQEIIQVESQQVVSYEPRCEESALALNVSEATPAMNSTVGITVKAFRGLGKKLKSARKSRGVPYAQKLIRLQIRAKMLMAAGQVLAGEIVEFGTDETTKGKHLFFRIKCYKCGKEKDLRSDNYWGQNQTCGCGADSNRYDKIGKVIDVIGANEDNLAKALETGTLPGQGSRGSYKASREQIYQHFGLVPSADTNVAAIKPSAAKLLVSLSWAIKYACSRIQCHWKEATWKRLGEHKVLQIAEAVRDYGIGWAARLCDGCQATAHACMRWVLQGFPQIDTLHCA